MPPFWIPRIKTERHIALRLPTCPRTIGALMVAYGAQYAHVTLSPGTKGFCSHQVSVVWIFGSSLQSHYPPLMRGCSWASAFAFRRAQPPMLLRVISISGTDYFGSSCSQTRCHTPSFHWCLICNPPPQFCYCLTFQKPTFAQQLIVSPLDGIICVLTNLKAKLL